MLLYLFLATLPCDVLSGFLVFSDRVAYPMYHSTHRMGGLSPFRGPAVRCRVDVDLCDHRLPGGRNDSLDPDTLAEAQTPTG